MRELAKQVAQTLRAELTFAKPPTRDDLRLCDAPPERVAFVKKGKISAAKASLISEMSDQVGMGHSFCTTCAMWVQETGMEVDHAISRSQIEKRQKTFLNYHKRFILWKKSR